MLYEYRFAPPFLFLFLFFGVAHRTETHTAKAHTKKAANAASFGRGGALEHDAWRCLVGAIRNNTLCSFRAISLSRSNTYEVKL